MERIADQRYLLNDQYKDSSKLSARIQLHELFSTNTHGWMPWVFDHFVDLPEDARILELGSGRGSLWKENLSRVPSGWYITLSDLLPGMRDNAKMNLEKAGREFAYKNIDAQAIPYPDDTFDGVVANHMLYHVPDRAKAVAEIHRVLKSGGCLFAATNGRGSMRALWEMINTVAPPFVSEFGRPANRFTLESGEVELRKKSPMLWSTVMRTNCMLQRSSRSLTTFGLRVVNSQTRRSRN
jgi:ubiquinone/menaquinone biosynthesis C-methylase UbiE